VYLVFALLLERHVPIVESGIAEEWVRELVKYHEFHHVHARHCRYYKEFSEYVSVIVGDAQPKAWMCDGFPDRQAMD
jgi:hypothetical protein